MVSYFSATIVEISGTGVAREITVFKKAGKSPSFEVHLCRLPFYEEKDYRKEGPALSSI